MKQSIFDTLLGNTSALLDYAEREELRYLQLQIDEGDKEGRTARLRNAQPRIREILCDARHRLRTEAQNYLEGAISLNKVAGVEPSELDLEVAAAANELC